MGVSRALVVGVALILTISVFFFLAYPTIDGPTANVGTIDDFPSGSITHLELTVRVTDPHPEIAKHFFDDEATLPILVVNHPQHGILALSLFDPHLGCRVGLASDWYSGIGRPLPAEIAFVNPCHGEKYDLAGAYVAGPAPRGMDRYRVTVRQGEIAVDFSAFEYGPDRQGR